MINQELKMVLFFSVFLLIVKTPCVFSLLHGKCLVYKDVEEFPAETSCDGKTNTAFCYHVTNIKKDLHGLPSNLLNLCIHMDSDIVSGYAALAPGSFSNFVSLEYLEITGCFSDISSEAFNGLVNVTTFKLSFLPKHCCEVAVDFSGFPSLTRLFLSQYSLSLMATNVFDTIPQLKELEIGMCLNNLSEVLCRLANLKSLKRFLLYDQELNSLKFPNCSFFYPSDDYISTVYNIEKVNLDLQSVQHVDQGALGVLGNLFYLEFGLRIDLLRELSLIGVNKIHSLQFTVDVLNIDELCRAAKLYSIESISVYYQTINFPPTTTMISEGIRCQYLSICEEIKEIVLRNEPEFTEDVILLDVHLIFQIFSNLSIFGVANHVLRPTDFQSLCSSFPQSVKQLSIMSLNSNNIGKVISHQFMCFTNLETLELVRSNISIIQNFSFIGLIKLKHLNLCKNKLSYIYQDTFSGLYGLTVLDLQENPIIQIETNSFGHLINLCTLLLGDLNFPPHMSLIKLNLSDIFGRIPYNLSHMLISSGLRPMQLMIGSNTTLNKSLDFTIKGQYVTVEDCNSQILTSIVKLQINAAYVTCGKEFIGKYARSVVNLEFKSMFSDDIGDLVVINELVHLKTLRLENIDLSKQTNLEIMFHNLTKLRTLTLMNCRIFFLDGSLTKDLSALTGLVLIPQENVNILQNFVEHLTSLKYLHLLELKLYCSCDNAWLVSWVKDNRQVQVAMFMPTMKELQCLADNGIDHLNFILYTKENCSFSIEFVLFVSTCAFLIFFMIAVLSYQCAGQYIKPFYHIASGWFREALHLNAKQRYRYDVFVSYSCKDEHWVMNELLPNLERRGPPFLRVCLHSRDFRLGQDIVENITDSIYASRRTLCLVSHNYLRSNWCSLEMQLATYRLQVEHRDILNLVFLEKIPSRLLSSHHRLARLIKSRTYLDWPLDPEMHEAFWHRLWCKLNS